MFIERKWPNQTLIAELVPRLRAGDESVIEPLIMEHLNLARTLAGRFLKTGYRHRGSDVISVAYTALVMALNRASEKLKDNNLTPYIVSTIIGTIRDYIKTDRLIPVHKAAFKKLMEKCESDEERAEKLIKMTDMVQPNGEVIDAVDTRRSEDELKALILDVLSVCQTDRDKLIVMYRFLGYTEQEIGDEIGIDHSNVHRNIEKIGKRYVS